jgi:hypothetical protein
MSQISDIEAMIAELTPAQIRAIMGKVNEPSRVRHTYSKYAEHRAKVNKLYFDNVSSHYVFDNHKDYLNHSDGLRHQVLSGADING